MRLVKLLATALLGAVLLGLAFLALLFLTRGTPVTGISAVGQVGGAPAVGSAGFLRSASLLAGAMLLPGHDVAVLADGDGTFPRLLADIEAARSTVTLQLYYADPGRLADTLAVALAAAASRGIRTLLLYDAFGSTLSDDYWDRLRSAGVAVAQFRPVKWYSLHKAQLRAHGRAVVIDGRIGYTGGFGIADKWLGSGRRAGEWRETNVRFAGPAVGQLQAAFAAMWAEASGELITGDVFFPPADTTSGGVTAALIHSAPPAGSTPIERLLAITIAGAQRTLFIANAYFVPDDDLRRMLGEAAARGVDVRVLLPGERTDVSIVRHAGRAHYEELLAAGARVFEYQPTMMHAKTVVADGLWSVIGSMNFDNRSIALNEETVFVAADPRVGATMDSLFLADLEFSREIMLAAFRRRGWSDRVLERVFLGFARIL
ncbi:MAG: phospholipase D-like domain-containing protein [Longimicrobiales bacterium]